LWRAEQRFVEAGEYVKVDAAGARGDHLGAAQRQLCGITRGDSRYDSTRFDRPISIS
jgi:hypothetical protein